MARRGQGGSSPEDALETDRHHPEASSMTTLMTKKGRKRETGGVAVSNKGATSKTRGRRSHAPRLPGWWAGWAAGPPACSLLA